MVTLLVANEVEADKGAAAATSPLASGPSLAPQPLTVLLGQLYFSKTSCTRSSPPSVNIMIILLQLARVMLDCGAERWRLRWDPEPAALGWMWPGGLAPTHLFPQPVFLG